MDNYFLCNTFNTVMIIQIHMITFVSELCFHILHVLFQNAMQGNQKWENIYKKSRLSCTMYCVYIFTCTCTLCLHYVYLTVLFSLVLADILANPQDKKQKMFDKFGYDSEAISDAPVLPKNASKAELKPSTNGQLAVSSNNQQVKAKEEKKGELFFLFCTLIMWGYLHYSPLTVLNTVLFTLFCFMEHIHVPFFVCRRSNLKYWCRLIKQNCCRWSSFTSTYKGECQGW